MAEAVEGGGRQTAHTGDGAEKAGEHAGVPTQQAAMQGLHSLPHQMYDATLLEECKEARDSCVHSIYSMPACGQCAGASTPMMVT